ncbi:glycosyltransferase family 2 protein [Aestuariibaculum sediminum]|uniref:Glycosyltransferase n=1 Tax=Aestuariibaculum sediminum TaxID=2770637 RepID=A0A8J6UBQ7_9FLAO|nr:glycosyltransferase family 2 protein [Aestuariibaculum sediminum]MBD0831209.1 glycosyltransferase [Aestuariibaculum sediminum]
MPLVSIITITYNSESTIRDTIESILNQTYCKIEYVIIDGASNDNTLSIINSYKETILKKGISLKLVSENDNGIADAWNKGLRLCSGNIIGILNSDDWYENNAIEKVVSCLNVDKPELSYGICKRVDIHKNVVETMDRVFNPKRIYLNFGFSHTTCFATKKLYSQIGFFKEDYKIALDTDFLLRAFKQNIKFKRCSNITYMRLGGISTNFKSKALKEHERAMLNNGFNPMLIFLFGILKRGILIKQKFN